MAEKINYKDYIAQLGTVETDQAARIKKYLEEQIQNDEALKTLYRPEKIDDCYDFITNAVKEMPRNGSCACIEDSIVFKMARDYFIEILPKVADEPPAVKSTGAETAEKAETEAETELETEEKPADNENSGTPCEEAEPENKKPEEAMLHQACNKGDKSAELENSEAEKVTEEKGAETAEEATMDNTEPKAEPENKKPEASESKFDEEGNGLLFDF